ncbi:MAG: aspartate--tRNA(Asp/Asn) ligase [Candidatus Pelagibacterales bacterium]|nr:MAG: aspartate--tRNA(Asp/Asn) ligase [Pelagibacterales bacterium]
MNKYRTHNCNQLRLEDAGSKVSLAGWINRKRDHGNVLFVDLRDHYGVTQCVIEKTNTKLLNLVDSLRVETVIKIDGTVIKREPDTINKSLNTGTIEIAVDNVEVLSEAKELPMPVFGENDYPEEIRLKYRFLDIRREELHKNIVLRSSIISHIRKLMSDAGFLEMQTPILTASSPEGARDYLVPSRIHPGKFYALPQAPQQFKQLIMAGGFDKYFQIAPCFRDEDARADRSPGEFYQLDMEMAFVEQDDVFNAIEPILHSVFTTFSDFNVTETPFPRITYADAMSRYGTDKPDLRNPINISNLTKEFNDDKVEFSAFKKIIKEGGEVIGIPAPDSSQKPRSFFDNLNNWARKEMNAAGLGYIVFDKSSSGVEGKGPIAKFIPSEIQEMILNKAGLKAGDSIFFACAKGKEVYDIAAAARDKIAIDLDLIEKGVFKFCWIVDFPMYEKDKETGKIDFSHNPFSMPQGGLEALNNSDPLNVLGYQYDIVCNGVELSSGAIRNHVPEIMYKAFEIAGYSKDQVHEKFGGMINAFTYGVPPHGGIAPGIDRIVMLLAQEKNIREVILFPMNQQAQDLMMLAPAEVDKTTLDELNLEVKPTEE